MSLPVYAPPTGTWVYPVVADFKGWYVRDFNYAVPLSGASQDATNPDYVQDTDITNALIAMCARINPDLWGTQNTFSLAALLMTAHFLVVSLGSGAQGVTGSGGGWLNTSVTAGDVTAVQDFPDRVKKSPVWAPYLRTTYGSQYAAMALPLCVANFRGAFGHTKP
jgi:hypothetical protein